MNSFWDFLWLLFWTYVLIAYLVLLFRIFIDLFRDPDVGGFAKALWTIGLIFFPLLVALIYLIARGKGMAERQMGAARQAQAETDQYIKSVAGTTSAADQIASAKALLDNGSINQAEFDQLKAKALA
jgi:hypothetical protein